MFTRHHGEEAVGAGTYLCLNSGEFITVDGETRTLPGPAKASYLKVSPIVALLLGPLAGLAFVIFLPLAVPALVLWLVAGRLWRSAPALVQRAYSLGNRPMAFAGEAPVRGATMRERSAEPQELDDLLGEMSGKLDRGDKK